MNFELFSNMSTEDAELFLHSFQTQGKQWIISETRSFELEGIRMDYSMSSACALYRRTLAKTKYLVKENESIEPWIKTANIKYAKMVVIDEGSSESLLSTSYYIGQCFVRNYDTLYWAVGRTETAIAKAPVVSGFRNETELCPILVVENLIKRAILFPEMPHDIKSTIETWQNMI